MLTSKQHELMQFIHAKLEETGISPSFEEMKDALELKSKSGVHRLISALEERGFIRRLPNRARALEILKQPGDAVPNMTASARARQAVSRSANDDTKGGASYGRDVPEPANDIVNLPLHGRIAAGAPIQAFEQDTNLPVPAALLGPGEHYALEVSGDSMIEAGIFDGDFALIKRTDTARDGEIVVALINQEEATLKYLSRDGATVRLDPANATHQPQMYRSGEVEVQGKLAGLLRRYN